MNTINSIQHYLAITLIRCVVGLLFAYGLNIMIQQTMTHYVQLTLAAHKLTK